MKLNLGCGNKLLDGFVNVDKFDYYNCDVVHDLELFPYPFENDSVNHILLSHVLEHIGQDPEIFNNILLEFYRICKNDALIDIFVPHPRHDDFISDPTHVRPITVLGLSLYDKKQNEIWQSNGAANTPLALIHGVDFRIENVEYVIENNILKSYQSGEIKQNELDHMMKHHNNVIKQTNIKWRVKKD